MISEASNGPEFGYLGQQLPNDILKPQEVVVDLRPNVDINDIKSYIQALHQTGFPIDDTEVDTMLLGARSTDADAQLIGRYERADLRALYPGEQLWFPARDGVWTGYDVIRETVKVLDLNKEDTLYDLGSGYGRMTLYAGITTPAKCKGIEIFPERIRLAKQAQARLELDNVEFIQDSVLDQDYSDGDVFYLYLPFSKETFKKVFDDLEQIAANKPIRIVARGGHTFFAHEKWLKLTDLRIPEELTWNTSLSIFESC